MAGHGELSKAKALRAAAVAVHGALNGYNPQSFKNTQLILLREALKTRDAGPITNDEGARMKTAQLLLT